MPNLSMIGRLAVVTGGSGGIGAACVVSGSLSRRAFVAVSGLALIPRVRAQAGYPDHAISLIHGFGPGGNADVVARLVAEKLQTQMGQAVVVDIKSGAGGAIATAFVAKAKPDGYTLLMLTGAHTVLAASGKPEPYDAVKSIAFISTVSSFPFVIAVKAESPIKSLPDLLASARKNPGKITFTSVGVGSTQHMVGEMLASTAGVRMLHVPYRGGGAPIQAVLAGDVDVLADTITVASPQLKSGRLRALAVTSPQAWTSLPGVPPVSATLPGFEILSWLGLGAPAGTPEAVVRRLGAEVNQALAAPDLKKTLADLGSQASPSSPEQMHQMVEDEIAKWRKLIDKAGIAI